ncbi:hypothetical protein BpHYR1_036670 [Brachionus plicatilis]|uniref:Uncharacterized protein n=1 Tax=Brachionus plicatilis TaxID=10195 RepID=A0A3M7P4Q3_BRAPC|nr:hypothetical protein BpHYR1_036670 [Brachionus plicatilis]
MNSNLLSFAVDSQTVDSNLPLINYQNNLQYIDEHAKLFQNFRIALEIKQIRVRYLELENVEKTHQNAIRLNDLLLKHLDKGEYDKALQVKKIINCDDQAKIEEAESGYESENLNLDFSENVQKNESEILAKENSEQIIETNSTETNDSEIEILRMPIQDTSLATERCSMTENDTSSNKHIFSFSNGDNYGSTKKNNNFDQTTYFVTCSSDKPYHSKMKILFKAEKFECISSQSDKYDCDIKGLHYHLIVKFGCKYHLSYLYKRLNLPFFKVYL